MKNSIKNLSRKVSSFIKKGVKSFKSTFKKYPKMLGFFAVILFITPFTFVHAGVISDAILWAIEFIVGIFKTLSTMFVYTAGLLFDNLIVVTLSTDMYDASWVKLGWALIRDVANIAFILGIVIIGIFMIIGKTQWQKMLINLIIVAFIMNFSMFFGRVIIDAGNFTSAIFYSMSSVSVTDAKQYESKNETTTSTTFSGIAASDRFDIAKAILGGKPHGWKPYFGNRSIASGLISFVDPTALFSTEGFKQLSDSKNMDETTIKSTKIVLDIVFIITMVFMSIVFIRTSFMFISRTIHLIKWIIVAPAYFAWYFLPSGEKRLYEWFGEIVNKAFCVTSYMIGLWIIFLFLSGNVETTLKAIVAGKGILTLIALVSIKFFIIYKAMNMLTDMGTKNCNDGTEYGKGVAGTFGKVAGFISGGMAGKGLKLLGGIGGRATAGRLGDRLRSLNIRKDEYTKNERLQTHIRLKEMREDELAVISGVRLGGGSEDDVNKIKEQEKNRRREFAEEEKRKKSGTRGLSQSDSLLTRTIGKKLQSWGGKVDNVKIGGKSYKDVTDERSKSISETTTMAESINGEDGKNEMLFSTTGGNNTKFSNRETEIKFQELVSAGVSNAKKGKFIRKNANKIIKKDGLMGFLLGNAAEKQYLNLQGLASDVDQKQKAQKQKKKNIELKYKSDKTEKERGLIEKEKEMNEKLFDSKSRLSEANEKEVKNIDSLADKFKTIYNELGESNILNKKTPNQIVEIAKNDTRFSQQLENFDDKKYIASSNVLKTNKDNLKTLKENFEDYKVNGRDSILSTNSDYADKNNLLKKTISKGDDKMTKELELEIKEIESNTDKKFNEGIVIKQQNIRIAKDRAEQAEKIIEKEKKKVDLVFKKTEEIIKEKTNIAKKDIRNKIKDQIEETREKRDQTVKKIEKENERLGEEKKQAEKYIESGHEYTPEGFNQTTTDTTVHTHL